VSERKLKLDSGHVSPDSGQQTALDCMPAMCRDLAHLVDRQQTDLVLGSVSKLRISRNS